MFEKRAEVSNPRPAGIPLFPPSGIPGEEDVLTPRRGRNQVGIETYSCNDAAFTYLPLTAVAYPAER